MTDQQNEPPWEKEETKDTASWLTCVPLTRLKNLILAGALLVFITYKTMPLVERELQRKNERITSEQIYDDMTARGIFYGRLGGKIDNLNLTYKQVKGELEEICGQRVINYRQEYDDFTVSAGICYWITPNTILGISGLALLDGNVPMKKATNYRNRALRVGGPNNLPITSNVTLANGSIVLLDERTQRMLIYFNERQAQELLRRHDPEYSQTK